MSFDESVQDKISQVAKKAEDTYSMLSNCYLELENLKMEHAQIYAALASKPESSVLTSEISKVYAAFDPIQKKILNLDDHKDMLQALVREIKNGYKELSGFVAGHSDKIDEVFKAIEFVKGLVSQARTDLDVNMNATVSNAKKDIHSVIASLPIPKDSVSSTQMREHVDHAIQSVKLDAQNAFDSTKNHEIRLDVLEKKIESILIKIKNVELKTQ